MHVHWVLDGDDAAAEACERSGMVLQRQLFQMRRPLPVGEAWELDTRPFVVGEDEAAWLPVNNRAFAGHPEQGGWELEQLQAKEREPWFETAGFLLH